MKLAKLREKAEEVIRNKAFQASIYAIGIVVTQMMNVAQVGVIGPTLFGTVSHGIWVSTIELQLMVLLQMVLGPLAALGVIFTAFAFSLTVSEPSFIMATIMSKVISLGATSIIFYLTRHWKVRHRLNLAWFAALEIDVLAFALLAGLPEIIQSALIIRAVLHATTMTIVYGFLQGKETEHVSADSR